MLLDDLDIGIIGGWESDSNTKYQKAFYVIFPFIPCELYFH